MSTRGPRRAVTLGFVLEADRGSLPFALVHGESLVACAAWALGDAEVTAVDLGTTWAEVAAAEEAVVLHDPLCPLTPASFIASCVERSAAEDAVVLGVRPVTDTVKEVLGGVVGATVDRSELRAVASPLVLPANVVAQLPGLPTTDLAALADELRTRHRLVLVEAPPEARRVNSEADVRVLEALTAR